jgi:hypothetical protein
MPVVIIIPYTPLFTHHVQTPLKIHLRLTSPENPTLCYYYVLLNRSNLHVYLLFAKRVYYSYFVLHYWYWERWGSDNA